MEKIAYVHWVWWEDPNVITSYFCTSDYRKEGALNEVLQPMSKANIISSPKRPGDSPAGLNPLCKL